MRLSPLPLHLRDDDANAGRLAHFLRCIWLAGNVAKLVNDRFSASIQAARMLHMGLGFSRSRVTAIRALGLRVSQSGL